MADAYKKLGAGGVDLVRQAFAVDDTTVRSAQNAELVFDKGLSGRSSLRKRGGLVSSSDVGAAIFEMYEVKFIDEIIPDPEPAPGDIVPDNRVESNNFWDTSPLWSKLDEAVADDSDYVVTTRHGVTNDVFVISLGPTSFTGPATAGTLRIRLQWLEAGLGAPLVGVTVSLVTLTPVLPLCSAIVPTAEMTTGSYTTHELDIIADMGYAGAPFDWTDIGIQVEADGYAEIRCSWINLSMTHA